MPLAAGARLGPYEILAPVASGGMGEVYRARDTRLLREVAVKVLPAEVAADPARRQRFEVECRAVAALNHPNIVAVHDVGEDSGTVYMVTELVDGASLEGASYSAAKAADIAAQTAGGLAAAHAAGVTHRDLKPANIMVTRAGLVKILDFGLAKIASAPPPEHTPTVTNFRTEPGAVMGTVGYMSPEQVRGREADHRTDIFSLGVVLYELLSGRRAFQAESAAEAMSAIAREPLPPLTGAVPEPLRRIVARCVEKEPESRFQSASDLAFALRSLGTSPDAAPARGSRLPYVAAAAVMVAGIAIAAAALLTRPESDLSGYRFTPLASESAAERDPAWSPDGQSIAYAVPGPGHPRVFLRRLGQPAAEQLAALDRPCRSPFFSPDGNRLFLTCGAGLYSLPVIGGQLEEVKSGVRLAAIAPDGKRMAVVEARERGAGTLAFGRLGGQEWTPYGAPPFPKEFSPGLAMAFSPDGKQVAVWTAQAGSGRFGGGAGGIWLVPYPPGSGAPRRVFHEMLETGGLGGFSWMPDSRHMVLSAGPADLPLQLYLGDTRTGKLRAITAGLEPLSAPAVSPDGKRIACVQGAASEDLIEIGLEGSSVRPVLITARNESSGVWLPNGREFAYATNSNGPVEIWARSAEDNRPRPLVAAGHEGLPPWIGLSRPAFSPDSTRMAFEVTSAEHTIWITRLGGGKAMRLDPEDGDHHAPAWSPDGNWVAYARLRAEALLMKAPAGGGAPVAIGRLRGGPAHAVLVAWSPKGDWIAAASSDLRLFAPGGGGERALGPAMLAGIAFAPDGRTLYGLRREEDGWSLAAFDVATGASRRLGSPAVEDGVLLAGLGPHPDGKRFLTTRVRPNLDILLIEGFAPPR